MAISLGILTQHFQTNPYSQGIPRYCILISSSMFESLVPLLYRVSTRLRMSPRGFFAAQCWHLFKWCAWVERGICSKTETTSDCFAYFGWFCILCRVPLSRYSEVRDVGLIWTLRELCGEFVRLLSPLNRVVDSRKQFYKVLYIHIYIYCESHHCCTICLTWSPIPTIDIQPGVKLPGTSNDQQHFLAQGAHPFRCGRVADSLLGQLAFRTRPSNLTRGHTFAVRHRSWI